MSNITIEECEVLFKLVIQKLKNDRLSHFEFNMDDYWIITADEWNEFTDAPQPVVESFAEDIGYLKTAIKEKAIYTYSDFNRLATVLRAISQMQAPIP